MREVLRRAVARGELAARVDLELALDLLHGPFFYRATWTGAPVDVALARDVARTVLGGLRGDR